MVYRKPAEPNSINTSSSTIDRPPGLSLSQQSLESEKIEKTNSSSLWWENDQMNPWNTDWGLSDNNLNTSDDFSWTDSSSLLSRAEPNTNWESNIQDSSFSEPFRHQQVRTDPPPQSFIPFHQLPNRAPQPEPNQFQRDSWNMLGFDANWKFSDDSSFWSTQQVPENIPRFQPQFSQNQWNSSYDRENNQYPHSFYSPAPNYQDNSFSPFNLYQQSNSPWSNLNTQFTNNSSSTDYIENENTKPVEKNIEYPNTPKTSENLGR